VLTLLLAGYFAQQYLPPPKPKVLGIDLGMTLRDCLITWLIFSFCYRHINTLASLEARKVWVNCGSKCPRR